MHTLDLHHLNNLCELQSTPGDEHAVMSYMKAVFRKNGYLVREHGIYALTAASPVWKDSNPTLMVCAHADSPGFVISELKTQHKGTAISLGAPDCTHLPQDVYITRSTGTPVRGRLSMLCPEKKTYSIRASCTLSRGDRISYMPVYKGLDSHGILKASFLDNRVGCWLLCNMAEFVYADDVNLILAVTAGEEMTGFGADIIAHSYKPDAVICLDTTYENAAQGIAMGKGPVVTASDKSVILNPRICNALASRAKLLDIPLQFEYYNYSGTDARAFPAAGYSGPVYAILLPTQGNHSPIETASDKDLIWMQQLLHAQIQPSSVHALMDMWKL